MVVLGSVLLVVSGGSLALLYGMSSRYNNAAGRDDFLDDSVRNQAAAAPEGPFNFLVLGTDTRADEQSSSLDGASTSRSDTIMLVHVAKGLGSAFIVSIPRDSYVNIPRVQGQWGGGLTKINAAFAYGGGKLMAQTINALSGVKFDGAMLINFEGVQNMVNAVGGINMCMPYDVGNWFPDFKQYGPDKVRSEGGVTYPGWLKGKCYDFDGGAALVFARQRHAVPGGDFGRMKNQQLVMKALAEKATSAGIIANPLKLDALLLAAAKSLTLDKSMNLRDLAFKLKGIKPSEIKFATLPYIGAKTIDGQSVVQLDKAADDALWQAILNDKTDDWLAQHPQSDVASWNPNNSAVTPTATATATTKPTR
jgi:LCP family protein required for cell wall assembly